MMIGTLGLDGNISYS